MDGQKPIHSTPFEDVARPGSIFELDRIVRLGNLYEVAFSGP